MKKIFYDEKKAARILYSEDFSISSRENINAAKIDQKPNVNVEKDIFLPNENLEEHYQRGIREGRRLEKELYHDRELELLKQEKNRNETIEEIKKISLRTFDLNREVSKCIVQLFSESIVLLFPELLKNYGTEDSKKILHKISHYINDRSKIELTCSKELSEKISEYFSGREWSGVSVIVDENIKNGDFKISWDKGRFVRNVNETILEIASEIFSLHSNK